VLCTDIGHGEELVDTLSAELVPACEDKYPVRLPTELALFNARRLSLLDYSVSLLGLKSSDFTKAFNFCRFFV
jgi:hypothetical protein